jgi:hypothetical protein
MWGLLQRIQKSTGFLSDILFSLNHDCFIWGQVTYIIPFKANYHNSLRRQHSSSLMASASEAINPIIVQQHVCLL